eukprot:PLAT15017.1.p2 GENE.PLAT15017.1~~PLAT15017.1.p2  ORF type:complete len:144 (+),score=48.52 PLAT15017.1:18-449(+)
MLRWWTPERFDPDHAATRELPKWSGDDIAEFRAAHPRHGGRLLYNQAVGAGVTVGTVAAAAAGGLAFYRSSKVGLLGVTGGLLAGMTAFVWLDILAYPDAKQRKLTERSKQAFLTWWARKNGVVGWQRDWEAYTPSKFDWPKE